MATSGSMFRASRAATASVEASPVSAKTVFGRPMPCPMPRMVEAKLGASAVVVTPPVARISCDPSAQTTAWAL
jgi:hypothetical protein